MEGYPEHWIRGIYNDSYLDSEKNVSTRLFIFSENEGDTKRICTDTGCPIEWIEKSISWYDREEAITVTMNQIKEKDGSLLFKTGVAIFPTSELETIKKSARFNQRFDYERKSNDHPFHGNLKLKSDVPKDVMIKIASKIALSCEDVKRNTTIPSSPVMTFGGTTTTQ